MTQPRDPVTGRFTPDNHLLAALRRQKPQHAATLAALHQTPRETRETNSRKETWHPLKP